MAEGTKRSTLFHGEIHASAVGMIFQFCTAVGMIFQYCSFHFSFHHTMETIVAELTVVDCFVANTDNELVGFEKMEILEEFEAKFWLPRNLPFHPATMACKASGYKGTHKEFTMGWCKALFSRAQAEDIRETRAQRRTLQEPASMPQANKRRRMSHTKPELPEYRFHGAQEDHHMVRIDGKKKPRTCTYCAYIAALNKGVGSSNFKVSKSRYYCFACGDFLCKDHEKPFHEKETREETTRVAV